MQILGVAERVFCRGCGGSWEENVWTVQRGEESVQISGEETGAAAQALGRWKDTGFFKILYPQAGGSWKRLVLGQRSCA